MYDEHNKVFYYVTINHYNFIIRDGVEMDEASFLGTAVRGSFRLSKIIIVKLLIK